MRLLLIYLAIIFSTNIYAHQSSTSFITLNQNDKVINGLWKVAIEDLIDIQKLDVNYDGDIQWEEIINNKNELLLMLKESLNIKTVQKICEVEYSSSRMALDTILDRSYVLLPFKMNCSINSIASINYNYYFTIDSDHKGIITFVDEKQESTIYVAAANNPEITINESTSDSFIDIVKEGIWHIWMGFDHIIFVLTLLFGVLFVSDNIKNTSSRVKQISEIIKVITAFTVAHSITLALAALDIINPSVRFIESAIALTLIIAALHNIKHLLPERTTNFFAWPIWKMAFVFGLIHGFGFANVLAEMNLYVTDVAKTLLAFNLGVEVGQLVIVAIFVTISFLLFSIFKLRSLKSLLNVSSALVMFIGAFWFVERAFDMVIF